MTDEESKVELRKRFEEWWNGAAVYLHNIPTIHKATVKDAYYAGAMAGVSMAMKIVADLQSSGKED